MRDYNLITVTGTGLTLGTAGHDKFDGDTNANEFMGFAGNDLFLGKGGSDQVVYEGAASDYTISRLPDGTVRISSALYGSDTLVDIESTWFNGSQQWYSLDSLVAQFGASGAIQGYGADPTTPFSTADYGTVLSKSMQFYYAQYSGDLPADFPLSWRGDSALQDGMYDKDGNFLGRDLTGGWYDAGDHVKFTFPMAATATTLAWGALDYRAGYEASGSYDDILTHLKWVNDYFLKAYDDKGTASLADDVFYAMVANPYVDHYSPWGPPEEMTALRPAYAVTATAPGTEVTAETAASMAATSIVMRQAGNIAYADQLLAKAQKLFAFADAYRGNYQDAITDENGNSLIAGFYNSWSGYQDELSWAAAWLYEATGNAAYLTKAEENFFGDVANPFSWDNKWIGVAAMLADQTGKTIYTDVLEEHIDYFASQPRTPGTSTNDGLAWYGPWGSNRYSANDSFIALQYADVLRDRDAVGNAQKITDLYNLAADQIDYMMGDNAANQSFVVGFGANSPLRPHHQAASGVYDKYDPRANLNVINGALVGGPSDPGGYYVDVRDDFVANEVATDYNAGFSGVLAGLIVRGGGGAPNVIQGTAAAELVVGTAGIDIIRALGGNDTLRGGAAADQLDGGDGTDLASYLDSTIGIWVELDDPTMNSGIAAGDSYISIEDLEGTGYNDDIWGNAAVNRLFGGNGNDRINGLDGNDTQYGQNGNDTLNGGNGDDLLYGGAGADRHEGGAGTDRATYLDATAGLTANLATPGQNTGIAAGDTYVGVEDLQGSAYADTLLGDTANNRLWGYNGNDTLRGADGNDALYGQNNNDSLQGDNGNDTLSGGAGSDVLNGGAGTDMATYSDATAGLTIHFGNIAANTGFAAGDSFAAIENLQGSQYADSLVGNTGTNSIYGLAGNDSIYGADGNDYVFGEVGNDLVFGDAGNDWIEGGAGGDWNVGGTGTDIFVFRAACGADGISDFNTVGETIRLYGLGVSNFAQLQTKMTQTAAGTLLGFVDGSSVMIHGVNMTSLAADDFIFG